MRGLRHSLILGWLRCYWSCSSRFCSETTGTITGTVTDAQWRGPWQMQCYRYSTPNWGDPNRPNQLEGFVQLFRI